MLPFQFCSNVSAVLLLQQGNGMVPGYPYPMATSAWPEQALAAHPKVPQATRKAVAEALFRSVSFSHHEVGKERFQEYGLLFASSIRG